MHDGCNFPGLLTTGLGPLVKMRAIKQGCGEQRCPACSGLPRKASPPVHWQRRLHRRRALGAPNRTAETWLDRTRRIIKTEETIACDDWRRNGAGLAIRLALLRPEPVTFKSWSKELPGLPPAVWWAAAILCGWRHGYRGARQAVPRRHHAAGVSRDPRPGGFLARRRLTSAASLSAVVT